MERGAACSQLDLQFWILENDTCETHAKQIRFCLSTLVCESFPGISELHAYNDVALFVRQVAAADLRQATESRTRI